MCKNWCVVSGRESIHISSTFALLQVRSSSPYSPFREQFFRGPSSDMMITRIVQVIDEDVRPWQLSMKILQEHAQQSFRQARVRQARDRYNDEEVQLR